MWMSLKRWTQISDCRLAPSLFARRPWVPDRRKLPWGAALGRWEGRLRGRVEPPAHCLPRHPTVSFGSRIGSRGDFHISGTCRSPPARAQIGECSALPADRRLPRQPFWRCLSRALVDSPDLTSRLRDDAYPWPRRFSPSDPSSRLAKAAPPQARARATTRRLKGGEISRIL